MGVDLTLLPQYSESHNVDFSHDLIGLQREYDMFELIKKSAKVHHRVITDVFPDGIYTYVSRPDGDGEPCYGLTTEDPYGNLLTGITAWQLKNAFNGYTPGSWKNKAVKAYINELPDGLTIWLYWH